MTGDRNVHGGFTLIELMVVLVIVSLVAGIVMQRMTSLDSRWLHSEVVALRVRLNHASDRALMSQEEIVWRYDEPSNSYRFMARTGDNEWRESSAKGLGVQFLGRPLQFRLANEERAAHDGIATLAFYPGGEYTPFTLEIATAKHSGYVLSGDGFNDINLTVVTP